MQLITKNEILTNINELQFELMQINQLINSEVICVLIDGSVIRGDFCSFASDIDLTITTKNKNIDTSTKQLINKESH